MIGYRAISYIIDDNYDEVLLHQWVILVIIIW